jgi:hypothetical protein
LYGVDKRYRYAQTPVKVEYRFRVSRSEQSVSSPLRDPTASPEVGPAWLADDFTATTEVEARRRRRLLPCGWLALAARLPALLV